MEEDVESVERSAKLFKELNLALKTIYKDCNLLLIGIQSDFSTISSGLKPFTNLALYVLLKQFAELNIRNTTTELIGKGSDVDFITFFKNKVLEDSVSKIVPTREN